MILGVVGEYGANGSRYGQLLADIWDRRRRVNREKRPFAHVGDEPHVAVTFGNTDLVEISLTHGYFPFADFSASGAEAFRRATGMLVPEPSDLEGWSDDEETKMSPRVFGGPQLFQLPQETYPFFGVVFARMSLLARLCSPPCERGRVPAQRALARMMAADSPLWGRLDTFVPAVGDQALAVTACVGLDELEAVFLVRCETMDALAGFGWAVRRTSLGESLPSCSASMERVRTLVDRGVSATDWDRSPVLADTRTLLGALLQEASPDEEGVVRRPHDAPPPEKDPDPPFAWRLPPAPDGDASTGAVFVTHYKYAAGYEGEGLKRMRRDIGLGEQVEPPRADLLYVFGNWQGLAMGTSAPGELDGTGAEETPEQRDRRRALAYRHPPEVCSKASVYDRLFRLAGGRPPRADGAQDEEPRPPGIGTVTSAGIEGALDAGDPLHGGLLHDLEKRLVRARTGLIRRTLSEEDGPGSAWLRRWLGGARAGMVNYPLTSGVRNVMLTVFSMLEHRPEPAIDTLPTLAFLVEKAGELDKPPDAKPSERSLRRRRRPRRSDEAWRPAELYYVYRTVADYLTVTSRQGSALRPPGTDLSFEKSAGVTVPRDAFQAFASSLADELGVGRLPLLVVEGADGWPHVQTMPGGPARVSISSLALPEPLHWTYGHEVGHLSFLQVRFGDLGKEVAELRRAWARLHALAEPDDPIRDDETLDETLKQVAGRLRARCVSDPNDTTLLNAFADVVREVPADLVAFDMLREPDEPRATPHDDPPTQHDRFWFTAGPGLTLAVRHQNGQEAPDPRTTLPLLLRVYVVSRLLDGGDPWLWRRDLPSVLEQVTEAHDAGELATDDEAVLRLLALREDLDIHWRSWDACTDLRIDQLLHDEGPKTRWAGEVIECWLDLCAQIMHLWRPACLALAHDTEPPPWAVLESYPRTARELYVEALDDLIALSRRTTGDGCAPWLPPRRRNQGARGPLPSGRDADRLGLSPRGGIMPSHEELTFAREYATCVTRLLLRLADQTRAQRLAPLDEHVLHPSEPAEE